MKKSIIILIFFMYISLQASDGKIDINDIVQFTNHLGTSKFTTSEFNSKFDFNKDNKIDHQDYLFIMKSFGSKKGDKKYNEKFDFYPSEIKPSKIKIRNNTKKNLSPINLEPIIISSKYYFKVKKVILKVKYESSNITFFDDDNMILISDNIRNYKKYLNLISFLETYPEIKIAKQYKLAENFKIMENDNNIVLINDWIVYRKDYEFLANYKIKQNSKKTLLLNYENIPLYQFVDLMNKKINMKYSVANNIKYNKITVISYNGIQFKFLPETFISILQLYGYNIDLNNINYGSGLKNYKEKSIIIFNYDKLHNDKIEEKIQELESEKLKFAFIKEKKICLMLADNETVNEIGKKWDNIIKILSSKNFKKFQAFVFKPKLIKNKLLYRLAADAKQNQALINKVEICSLTYNYSVLISFPIELKKYITNLYKEVDSPTDDKRLLNEHTYIYKLVYVSSAKAAKFLNALYAKNNEDRITIVSSVQSNAIIVKSDNQKRIDEIKDTIKKIDKKPKQVLINVLIAEVKLDNLDRYGVEWKIGDKYNQSGFEANLRTSEQSSGIPLTGLKYSLLNGNKFDILLNMLNEKSAINVLSKPNIMAKNNSEAKIIIGKEVPIVKIKTNNSSNDNNNNNNNINDVPTNSDNITQNYIIKSNFSNVPELETEYKDVGITLKVTPNISADNNIMLNIDQIVSEIESVGVLNNPIIKKREAATTVIVKNKNTVIIGGMIKKDKVSSTKNVPFFSKIPILGKLLFSYKNNTYQRTELMIFITPTLISNDINQIPEKTLKRKLIKTD